jgi:hypothetical protein
MIIEPVHDRNKAEKKKKKKNGVREARAGPDRRRRCLSSHCLRLQLQGRGCQLLQAAVLRNELAVHLVAEVAERDGLEQPEIAHHLQAG